MSNYAIRPISAEATRPLRQRVLRPHQPVTELLYPGDEAPESLHVGAFDEGGAIVGVASIYREPREGVDGGAWRLRGMATDPEVRRKGCGAALLRACEAYARSREGTSIWCNARTTASAFYVAQGFVIEGEAFELPGIGLHYVMSKALAAHPPG